jgi:hypothetical protein
MGSERMSAMPRLSKKRVEQYRRVGVCNGAKCREEDKLRDVPLWRIGDDRWRCARCHKDETGSLP